MTRTPLYWMLTISLGVLAGCERPPAPQQAAPAASSPAPAPAPQAAAPAPAPGPAAAAPAAPAGPSLEARSHIKQGFAYIAAAKNASSRANYDENIENAVNEFSQAIAKEPGYAEAYSNRAVAYMQQKKFNKAQEDLKKAVELAPKSPAVHYNLASLYSLKGDVDLALDAIDSALASGFTDYDALRKDPDLDNVRKSPEFRKVLEKHKVFIVK
jgi:tetratricopeptide (TPR) repeat protein